MNERDARQGLASSEADGSEFEVLQLISRLLNANETAGRDLLIRVLNVRQRFEAYRDLVNALLGAYGLYPYLDTEYLTTAELLAFESHRPLDHDDPELVMHKVQASVYRRLLDGESVILSAPTSFGKSLILDAVACTGRFQNIAVVVPTLALIDETRRRLSRLSHMYKVVTHPTQTLEERNLLVMTQERLLEVPDLPNFDLFMIDEFYKLDGESDPDRSGLLNQALRVLVAKSNAFYLAGPNVTALSGTLPEKFMATFIATDFATVTSNVTLLPKPSKGEELSALVDLCARLEGSTLIYCSSPNKTRRAAAALLEAGYGGDADELGAAADWVASEYHPEWLVARAMRAGIGVHHARLPRWLGQYMVAAFNSGQLKYLICTSTLIEGVNTAAKNVVVLDHRIGRRALDYFTYSNIAGRSGRMRKHFVGEVFVFNRPPQEQLPTVDIPVYTQGPDTPPSLLIQLDDAEMTEQSRERMREVLSNPLLPIELLRSNRGMDPASQIRLAEDLIQNGARLRPLIRWQGMPTYDQLRASFELVIRHLRPISGYEYGAASASQLTFKMNLLASARGDIRELIENELLHGLPYVRGNPDTSVEEALTFVRQWPGFEVPRLLSTLESIANHVWMRESGPLAAYGGYLSRCADLFLPPKAAVLDEFGLPPNLIAKLLPRLGGTNDGVDAMVSAVKDLRLELLDLDDAERQLLADLQASL